MNVLRNENLLKKATYHSLASADADLDRGGRYGNLPKPSVAGTGPSGWAPQQPANSPWSRDHCPPEPPLGFSVEDQPTTGEAFEVQRSIDALSAKAAPNADDAGPRSIDGAIDGAGPRPSTFKRRI
jgi:hypothetical protein